MNELPHLYGIANCDTVRKARGWLDAAAIGYRFVDFRKEGIDRDQVADWLAACGPERLLNRRGTTWRNLDDSQRDSAEDPDKLTDLLCAEPTLIKRPVLVYAHRLEIGFKAENYQAIFT